MYNFVHNFFKNLQILYLKNKRLSVIVSKGNENGVLRKGRSGILRKNHIYYWEDILLIRCLYRRACSLTGKLFVWETSFRISSRRL